MENDLPHDSPCAQSHLQSGLPSIDVSATGALRILVVDDLVDAAETLATYLRMLGYAVHTAYDGAAVLPLAVALRPQVLMLDIGLPKLDGYQVAEQIRQNVNLQNACLIAISGYGTPADVEAARAAGFDHHFIKPVDVGQLQRLLRLIAEKRR